MSRWAHGLLAATLAKSCSVHLAANYQVDMVLSYSRRSIDRPSFLAIGQLLEGGLRAAHHALVPIAYQQQFLPPSIRLLNSWPWTVLHFTLHFLLVGVLHYICTIVVVSVSTIYKQNKKWTWPEPDIEISIIYCMGTRHRQTTATLVIMSGWPAFPTCIVQE